MNWKAILFACAAALAVVAAVPGCDDDDKIVECANIPSNGCTLNQGDDACVDPTCAAAYACNSDGTWTLAYNCPNFHPPPDASTSDGATEASGPSDDSGPGFDAAALPPGASGGPGCDLMYVQGDDCTASTAILCPPASIDRCCGCQSLFVCTNGNWVFWGECTEDGGVMQTN
jgi:hypothetical protein